MATPPPDKPPRTALDTQVTIKKIDAVVEIGREIIKWGGLVVLGYIGFLCIQSLSGKTTFADIGIRILGNVKVSDGILTFLAGSGWAYGFGQQFLRRRHIERTIPTKTALEIALDPKRSSSNLPPRGTTPKKGKR